MSRRRTQLSPGKPGRHAKPTPVYAFTRLQRTKPKPICVEVEVIEEERRPICVEVEVID